MTALSRRRAIQTAGALAVPFAVLPTVDRTILLPSAADGHDADPFVALWAEWQATKATYERAKEKFNTTWDKANFEQRRALSERDQSETFGRMMDVYAKIIATPATTLFGVVVKLRLAWEVTAWELGRDRDELDDDRLNVEHKMLRSVLADAELLADA